MFSPVIVSCMGFFFVIGAYLKIFSPYRIRNWNGFILLFLTFTFKLMFISTLPLCQVYLLYFLLCVDMNSFHCFYHTITVFYCVIESLFFLFTVEEAKLLNVRPLPERAPLPDDYDEQLIHRVPSVYKKAKEDFRVCFAGWFRGVKNSSYDLIYEENILQILAMITYRVRYWDEMTDEQQQHIKRLFYDGFLKKYPQQRSKIKSGFNNQIRMKNPYRDSIRYTHHPMVKYLLFACVRSITEMILQSIGFKLQIIDDITFYVRKYPNKTSSSPVLFLHGLSLGVNTYLLFLRRLTFLNRTIILLSVPYTSMRLHTELFSMSTILSSIERLLFSLNERHIVTIGHSYGTLIQSCIVKQLPHIVHNQAVIFIDPVCFLVFDSRYFRNFIYRRPRTPNQLLLHAFCTEDLFLIYAVERNQCWYECNLWAEDVKQSSIRIHVFLSENDDIIPISFVQKYFKRSNIDATIFLQFKHAQFLLSSKAQDNILEILHQLETQPEVDGNESMYF